MLPSAPRIPPLPESELPDELRESLPVLNGRLLNIFTTLARHPKLLKRWMVFAGHVLGKSTLTPRDREILILRTGWLCRSEYEWGQHVLIGRQVGLSNEEIGRITVGATAPGWDPFEATLLRAADELHEHFTIMDATWAALSVRFGTQELIDVVFTVGQYTLVSMALNAFGIRLDEGIEGFPR